MNRPSLSSAVLALATVALTACVSTDAARERGLAFYQSGNYLAAFDAFSDDIRLHPRDAAAWNDRAVARVRLGDLDGAIRDYNRAIVLTPSDGELYFNRGNAFVAAGQYDEAIADYDRAASVHPAYARAVFNRGTARALAGDRDGARRDWQTAIALESDPYERAAMRRSAGLAPVLAASAAPAGVPTTAGTIAPAPVLGTRPGALATPPVAAFPNAMEPAASPIALDARALAARAVSREIDGDHAGAIHDLTAAMAAEPDPQRRAAMERLRQLLDTPR